MDNHYEARETLYEKGVQRMKQAALVVQSAYRTENYKTAAEEFEGAGDYQDAADKAEECRRLAEQSEKDGVEERYQKAVAAQERIIDRSDADKLVDEFHLLGDYKDSKKRREECVARAERYIRISRIKRTAGLIVLIALIALGVYGVHAGMWDYVKGMLYGASGNYKVAMESFEKLGKFLDSEKKMEIYREKYLRAREADERTTLNTLEAGDETPYGEFNWLVLKADENELLLIPVKLREDGPFYHVPFDTEGGNDWETSSLKSYLNDKVFMEMFTEEERERIDTGIMIPDEKMLGEYQDAVAGLGMDVWVNLPGEADGTQSYLTGGGVLMRYGCPSDNSEISVCPVLHVKVVNVED